MCSVCVKAQTVTLTFITQDTVTVHIGKPVDGNYTSFYYASSIKLFPKQDENFSFEMKDLGLVHLRYSTGKEYDLYVYPNANLRINYDNGRVLATGDSAQGSNFFNSEYNNNKRIYDKKLRELFFNYIQTGKDLPESLADFKDSIPHIDLQTVDNLFSNGEITSEIANAIKKNAKYDEFAYLVDFYDEILSSKDLNLQKNDSVLIYAAIDSIYKNNPPDSCFAAYYRRDVYSGDYYGNIYNKLNDLDKKELLHTFGDDTFGPYIPRLLAPASIRLGTFFNAFVAQYIYSVDEFDRKKMLEYFSKEFPVSESFSIMSGIWRKNQQLHENKPIIITDTIYSLKELPALNVLKGNYIFIDLWASWCIPCRMQFAYNSELHELLERYHKLSLLYVSIDDSERAWTDAIHANLPGLHLRATKKLIEDIEDKIYVNDRLSIPRYILLDPEGNVVNSNMSRPSQIDNLKKELDEVLIH